MPQISIRHPLRSEEEEILKKDFPYFTFSTEVGEEMEVFFGEKLSLEEIELAPLLRWVHLTTPHLPQVSKEEIRKRGNILVTYTPEGSGDNHGEWAIGSALTLAKGFLGYRGIEPNLPTLSLMGKTWLEVPALGQKSLSHIQFAKRLGMKVLGISPGRAFVPYVDRSSSLEEFHSLLPHGDVLSLRTDQKVHPELCLLKEELALLKKGAILILSTEMKRVDLEGLETLILEGSLQGVAIDTKDDSFYARLKHLKNHPRVILTPGIANLPVAPTDPSFPHFRHLLRDYAYDNYVDMGPRLEV